MFTSRRQHARQHRNIQKENEYSECVAIQDVWERHHIAVRGRKRAKRRGRQVRTSFFEWCTGKGLPRTGHEGPKGEQMYSSTISLNSALDGVGGQRHTPAALPPGKTRYPLRGRLGGPQGQSGRVRKISLPPPEFDLWTVQSVARRYTDYASPAYSRVVCEHRKQRKRSFSSS